MTSSGSIKKEQDLYDFLKKNFIPDLIQTTRTASRYDCYSTKFGLDIELKCRRTHYDQLLIEKGKYEALMSRTGMFGTVPVYINSTPQGVWAFYLKEVDLKWETRSLPKQTDFGERYHIKKEIGYLDVETEGIDLLSLLRSSSSWQDSPA